MDLRDVILHMLMCLCVLCAVCCVLLCVCVYVLVSDCCVHPVQCRFMHSLRTFLARARGTKRIAESIPDIQLQRAYHVVLIRFHTPCQHTHAQHTAQHTADTQRERQTDTSTYTHTHINITRLLSCSCSSTPSLLIFSSSLPRLSIVLLSRCCTVLCHACDTLLHALALSLSLSLCLSLSCCMSFVIACMLSLCLVVFCYRQRNTLIQSTVRIDMHSRRTGAGAGIMHRHAQAQRHRHAQFAVHFLNVVQGRQECSAFCTHTTVTDSAGVSDAGCMV